MYKYQVFYNLDRYLFSLLEKVSFLYMTCRYSADTPEPSGCCSSIKVEQNIASIAFKKNVNILSSTERFIRSNHRFYKKRCFSIDFRFHSKTPVLESLFNKVAGLRPPALLKKRHQHSSFPMNFSKFFRTSILKNICERLLLTHLRLYMLIV